MLAFGAARILRPNQTCFAVGSVGTVVQEDRPGEAEDVEWPASWRVFPDAAISDADVTWLLSPISALRVCSLFDCPGLTWLRARRC